MPATPKKKIAQEILNLKARFNQAEGLPFNDVLSSEQFQRIFEEEIGSYRERTYTPIVTLNAFLSQALDDKDKSCNGAVSRVRAELASQGKEPCSANNGPYCKARQRLPRYLPERLAKETGRKLHENSLDEWNWKGRPIKTVDGSTLSMPDTPENQEEFPQPESQKAGVGFPIARIVASISLSTGSVIDFSMGPYQGKETGEHALMRQILDSFKAGDIVLGDRYYCSYFLIAMLLRKNVDVVFQLHASRKSDFRKGIRLGKKDHIVNWYKPISRPNWMDEETYNEMSDSLEIREIKSKGIVIATTILDHKFASRNDISKLYTKRWSIEVDLRHIKSVLKMDILRCKTPEMVEKEIWVHLLAYNLIRTVMAQAAYKYKISPRNLSFKGTIQELISFKYNLIRSNGIELKKMCGFVLEGVSSRRVGNRPGRSEPRAIKRRPNSSYPYFTESREKDRNRSFSRKKYA